MKTRNINLFLCLLLDFISATVSVLLGNFFGGIMGEVNFKTALLSVVCYPAIFILFMYVFKVYHIIWGFARNRDYIRIFAAAAVALVVTFFIQRTMFPEIDFNTLNVLVIYVFSIIFVCVIRSVFSTTKKSNKIEGEFLSGNIMIIGAGAAGSMLINDIQNNIDISNKKTHCSIKCVIDDDRSKLHQYIGGARVVGGSKDIVSVAEKYKIDTIIFAIPSCPRDRKTAILNLCQKTGCKIKVIPSLYQLISKETESRIDVNVSLLREIQIEDLLGRDPININLDAIMNYVSGKTVLVTGGGGSIGSELCRQIALHNPKQLIILDIYENNAYDIQNELIRNYPNLDLVTLIGSVRDKERLGNIFDKYRPDIVYHAAAHKHVPLMEESPNESIKNNVFGTANVAYCADKYSVGKFILISTDKAVNPTNIMGASKRICEMIIQCYNNHSKTEFVAVRFGNVLGSNGSVIPLFKSQIQKGGPVTVTHPDIIRYFMTIPEAVSLVIQAGATAKGGEIFVLDMGEPVKILDLAEKLITLSGYKPYTDIKIEFTGLRPGEKLFEELLMSEEGLKETENSLIHIGHPIDINEEFLENALRDMKEIMYKEDGDIRKTVKEIVPTYNYKV